jgi:fermentation-respiration switch protein FrsA (DUF1100 family)
LWDEPLFLSPACKHFGGFEKVVERTTILHFRQDEVIPFAESEGLLRLCGLPRSALVEVGNDHRLADHESLSALLRACERQQ